MRVAEAIRPQWTGLQNFIPNQIASVPLNLTHNCVITHPMESLLVKPFFMKDNVEIKDIDFRVLTIHTFRVLMPPTLTGNIAINNVTILLHKYEVLNAFAVANA